jgi:hypothetical protein
MLRYLYTGDYQDDEKANHFTPMLFSVHVNTIADKYNIPALVELAAAKFAARAEKEWNTEDFANAIDEMYTTSTQSKQAMQQSAIDAALINSRELYEKESGKLFREVADRTSTFISALAAGLASGKKKRKRADELSYTCLLQNCRSTWTTTTSPASRIDNGRNWVYCPHCGSTCARTSGKQVT